MKTNVLVVRGLLGLGLMLGELCGQSYAARWVTTWTTANAATDQPATFSNQTLRKIVHTTIGDSMLRLRLSNTLLSRDPLPVGVFCYNDPVAIGAMRAIIDAGLSVGRDIAVIGAGNVHYSNVLAIPLTTIDQGTARIGTQASEILMEQISSKRKLRPRTVLIGPKVVIRQSTTR